MAGGRAVAAGGLCLAWLSAVAALAQGADAVLPAQTVQPSQWRIQGQATMRFLGLAIYDATLTASSGFSPDAWAAQPMALTLVYHRGLSGEAIAERALQEMRRGGAIDDARAARWLAFMKSSFPDVRAGDRIVGHWSPDSGSVSIRVNDRAARELADREFGTRFFGIWLAPHTSEPEVRAGLLGRS
jgi:hypothetical protein